MVQPGDSVKQLKGFSKVELNPGLGQYKTEILGLDQYSVGWFDEKRGKWVAQKGGIYKLFVCTSSQEVHGELEIK